MNDLIAKIKIIFRASVWSEGSKKKKKAGKLWNLRQALLNFYLSAADLNQLHPGNGKAADLGDEKVQTFLF